MDHSQDDSATSEKVEGMTVGVDPAKEGAEKTNVLKFPTQPAAPGIELNPGEPLPEMKLILAEGHVVIVFGTPTDHFAMTPSSAESVAFGLLNRAMAIRMAENQPKVAATEVESARTILNEIMTSDDPLVKRFELMQWLCETQIKKLAAFVKT